MKRPTWVMYVAALALCYAGACAPALAAPAATAQPKARAAPRLERLGGVWSLGARIEGAATDIDGRPPPLTPWAQGLLDKRLQDAKEGKPFASAATRCLPYGTAYFLFAPVSGPMQIIEKPDQVTILSTEMSEVWMIHLNRPHLKNIEPGFHGDSIGHWEGQTLVIDTIGLSGDKTTIDREGTPHSDDLHIVTRMRRTGPNDLEEDL